MDLQLNVGWVERAEIALEVLEDSFSLVIDVSDDCRVKVVPVVQVRTDEYVLPATYALGLVDEVGSVGFLTNTTEGLEVQLTVLDCD